jgi:primosomal protein N' (replication factor Y) (superfamily II helicase)
MAWADLILPLPLDGVFTYLIPGGLEHEVLPGKRVLVPFGSKKIYSAIVKKVHDTAPVDFKAKEILSVLDRDPLISEIQIKFWEWISEYYMCAEGEVLKAAMPSGLRLESETRLLPAGEGQQIHQINDKEALILKMIENKPLSTINEITVASGGKPVYGIVKSLIDKNIIIARESLKEGPKPRKEAFISLHPSINTEARLHEITALLEKAPRQLELFLSYLEISEYTGNNLPAPEIPKKKLIRNTAGNGPVKALIDKHILIETSYDISRLLPTGEDQKEASNLNVFQAEALENITDLFKTREVVLLNGITSAGKTEIYIHLIERELARGRQVLYLLPEIALTAQIIIRLKHIFGEKAGVYHSKFSDSERTEIWNRVLRKDENDSYSLILGVRSSLFLPFSDIGLIIVDEEHENTFKQFDPAPRYHARDAAIMLASMHKAKTLLGTATPSVESYYNAQSGKYGLVNLTRRYLDIALPSIVIADTREARKRKKMKSLFTPQLLEGIELALSKNEQIILFQNRRGYALYIECSDCGWIPVCKHCDVSMTYHKTVNQMVCHYCGFSSRPGTVCPDCGSNDIRTRGFGTEKIEDEISIFFPGVKVGRLDLDSVRKKRAHERIIGDFEAGNLDILVGTQMIAKGLDFSGVSLVGIINADNLLFFPDFRAHERSFQLISQVSGRAGRKTRQGTVIIQTGFPDHPVIKNILSNNYRKNYLEQIYERKQFSYPPFVRLFRIILKDQHRETVEKASALLAENLRKRFGGRVLGPEYPLISRIQNRYIMNIMLKIEKGVALPKVRNLLRKEIGQIRSQPGFKTCIIIPDVDPV